ncbi:MAG TPA: LPS assembly protein LptD, partial [Caulobacteraceae bacterium]
ARAEARWGQGRSASLFVGRQFRAEEEPGYLRPVNGAPGQFYDPTGIAETASDWLIAATFVPFSRVSGQVRARIDGDTAEVRRMDASVVASFGLKNFAAISYGVDDTDPSPLTTNGNYEYLQGSGQFFFTRHWGVSGLAVRDQRRDALIRSELALVYDDECLRFELVYEREERLAPIGTSSALGLRPSEGVFIRLNLATLGDTGYGRTDTR